MKLLLSSNLGDKVGSPTGGLSVTVRLPGRICQGWEVMRKPKGWKRRTVKFLGGDFKCLLFSPLLGEMIQFD